MRSLVASDRRTKERREVYSWMLRVIYATGNCESRGSPRPTRSAGGGRRRVPGYRNVAGPPALFAPRAARTIQREADAHPRNRRRHTDGGFRIRHGRVLLELDAGAATGGTVLSRREL